MINLLTHYDGSIDWFGVIVFLLLIGLGIFLVGSIILMIITQIGFYLVQTQQQTATITNKYYSPAQSSTGVGFTPTAQGISPVVTTSTEEEAFTLEVEYEDKSRMRTDVSAAFFDACNINDTVIVHYKISKWLKRFKITDINKAP